jgi:predicted aspartyl protease
LADGSESVFDIYEATLDWDGEARRIAVDEAETVPLIGMSLLEGYELTVQIQRGGNVTLRTLSQTKTG